MPFGNRSATRRSKSKTCTLSSPKPASMPVSHGIVQLDPPCNASAHVSSVLPDNYKVKQQAPIFAKRNEILKTIPGFWLQAVRRLHPIWLISER